MKDVTTEDLVNRLILTAKATERATCIIKLSPTGANASKLRGAQRQERAALTALNRHLKMCVAEVKKGFITPNQVRRSLRLKSIRSKK